MAARSTPDARRRLPAVDRLLARPEMKALAGLYGSALVGVQAREELARLRQEPPAADEIAAALVELPARVAQGVERRLGAPRRPVINATGIFLHTNLGRAPLPREVAAALPPLLDRACDLEMDLATGRRGDRNRESARLLGELAGAEAALVANNNAAAITLAVAALAGGREVIVSRGELVEIGGSFRIPDILRAAGARLVEVGATNRTRLADYAAAIGEATGALLKVHPSNYRISGYTGTVEPAALAGLARERGLPLVVDEGAGLLRPDPRPPLAGHPSHRELLAAGADLVCGSGDKVLGGPQAGLLTGCAAAVAACRRHPLYRAVRPGRTTLAALELVLRRHLRGAPMPLDGLWPDPAAHGARLAKVAGAVGGEIAAAEAFVGGGAAPEEPIAGEAVALAGSQDLLRRLRTGEPSVAAYLREGRLWLDLRTVDPEDDEQLVAALAHARGRGD